MNAILLAALLALQAPAQQGQRRDDSARPGTSGAAATSTSLDGQWYLVYGEDHGSQIQAQRDQPVTIRNNQVTWTREGKQHTMRLEFGPHNTVRAYPADGTGTGASGTGRSETNRSGTGGTGTSGTGTSGTGASGTGTSRTGTGGTGTSGTGTSGTGTSGTATGARGGYHGVYILSKEFLCFAMDDSSASGTGTSGTGASGSRSGATGTSGSSGTGGTGTSGTSGTGTSRTGTSGTGTSGTGTSGTGTSGTGTSGTGRVGAMGQPQSSPLVLILSKRQMSGSSTGR